MEALAFWKAVTMDRSNFLDDLITLLKENSIRFCIIDVPAVNAYVEPLVSLDLVVVVAVEQIEQVRRLLKPRFNIEEFSHSLNVAAPASDLRVQIQTDPRYGEFLKRASTSDVLGLPLPVASIEDVLQGKIWAATDPQRRPTKRRKDLLDIERLIQAHPYLTALIPEPILTQISG
jgi:nucleotidyltransferase AbiEii toxin of type IV toxin-antitoxin system